MRRAMLVGLHRAVRCRHAMLDTARNAIEDMRLISLLVHLRAVLAQPAILEESPPHERTNHDDLQRHADDQASS